MEPRVAVAGCGAIGGMIAACAARAGLDVTVIDQWHAHVEAIRRTGLRVSGPVDELVTRVDARHLDELDASRFDVIVLAVKSYDTAWMTQVLEPRLAERGTVVSAQNALNEDAIAAIVGPQRTVGCVVHGGGSLPAPGHVERTSDPDWITFTIGALDGGAPLAAVDRVLAAAGRTRTSDRIRGPLWAKFTVNCLTNALGGLTGFTSAELWSDPRALDAVTQIGAEVAAVGAAAGQPVAPLVLTGVPGALEPDALIAARAGDPGARRAVAAYFGAAVGVRVGVRDNRSSLLQDILKRRRTEVDYLNGAVARMGAELGIPTPWNAAMPGLIRRLEAGELEIGAANLALVPA